MDTIFFQFLFNTILPLFSLAALLFAGWRIRLFYHSHNGSSSGSPATKAMPDHPDDVANFERIISILENERAFIDPYLTVDDLSGLVDLHPRRVSYLINFYAGMNFNQLVNKYRVEESKKLLSDNNYSNITMQGIAKISGFNSKSVFNLAFKAEVGITPSDFKKKVKK